MDGKTLKSRFRKILAWLRQDLWRKLGAVALVALLYMDYYSHPGDERDYANVQVRLEMAPGIFGASENEPQVTLKLRGSRKQLDNLDAAGLRVTAAVSAEDVRLQGNTPVYLKDRDVKGLPLGVQVAAIIPRELLLDLDRTGTEAKPVKADFDQAAYRQKGILLKDVTPAEVTLSGPAKRLREIGSVPTHPVLLEAEDLAGKDSVRYQVELLPLPDGITADPAHVWLQFEVVKHLNSKQFSGVPVEISAPPGNNGKIVRIAPDSVTVTLKGEDGVLENLKAADLYAFVRRTGELKPGKYKFKVGVMPGSGQNREIEVVRIYPENVEVEVK